MKWLPLAARFPKWAIAAAILIISSGIFLSWYWLRGSGGAEPAIEQLVSTPDTRDFKLDELVLCGNTLVNFRSGEIVTGEWLEDFGNAVPPIAGVFPDDKLVIASAGGIARAYGFDGKPKHPLAIDGKRMGPAAFSNERPEVIFVREGDLWRGGIDWVASSVADAKRVTDVGYFRENLFNGEWLWAGNDLYVSVLGRPHLVTLADGKVTSMQVPVGSLRNGASPDGKLTVVGTNLSEFAVGEFGSSSFERFPTIGTVKQVLWLTPERVAVLGGYRQLSVYDHGKRKIICSYQTKGQIAGIAGGSTDGGHLLVNSHAGMSIFAVESKRMIPLPMPVTSGVWLLADTLLCSTSVSDSEIRGLWLVKTDGSRERISGHPMDASPARGKSDPVVEVGDGALLVSGGNLWHFKTAGHSLRQVTQGQKLVPVLKMLVQQRPQP